MNGDFYALNASTGDLVWNYTTTGAVYSSPAVADGKVFVGSEDSVAVSNTLIVNEGIVYALNATNGAVVWNYTVLCVMGSSLAVAAGLVFVCSGEQVIALNESTGALVWHYATGFYVESSPAVVDGVVYVGSGDKSVYAVNATTGKKVWNYTTGSEVDSSPAVVDGMVFVTSDDNMTYGLNATNGAVVWKYRTGGEDWPSSPAVAAGLVFVGSEDKKVYALNATNGRLVWNYTTGSMISSSPAVASDIVFVGSDDGSFYALNESTGAFIWSYRTGGGALSSPAVADGKVYVGSENSRVYAFGPSHATGIIYINSDGSMSSPVPANITTTNNVTYTFTGNNSLPIIVNRSNIIINGMGHTLRGNGSDSSMGFSLSGVSNVTIENTTITNSGLGIGIYSSSGNVVSGNNVTANGADGIWLYYSSDNNTLSGNNVTANSWYGIDLVSSYDNVLSDNNVTANSWYGIDLYLSSGNVLSGNNVMANGFGIYLESSSDNNTLSGNNVTANGRYGISVYSSSGNTIFHNDFINNTQQTNVFSSTNTWDDDYPSGGNYWSDYRTRYPNAAENDSSGIWNASYVIDASNIDRYPLMGQFHAFGVGTWNGTAYSVDTVSNSTITNVSFNATAKALTFNVTGPSSAVGFCRIAIPRALMWCGNETQWAVVMEGNIGSLLVLFHPHLSIMTDANYTYIYFAYAYNTPKVLITSTNAIPEFQPLVLLPLLMMMTLLTAIASKKKRKVVHITKSAKE
jgi:parallel beta-helix repeat protein